MNARPQEAYIVAAQRLPVGRRNGVFAHVRPDDMLAHALRTVLAQAPGLDANEIDDVIVGCAMPEAEQGMNVARVAMGADPQQTLKAFREAEAYDGPSLILAYSHCIAHGIDMRKGLDQQYLAVNSGHWPLMRFNPVLRVAGQNPFLLDSPRPRFPLRRYHDNELRFRMLKNTDPEAAERMLDFGQRHVDRRWRDYEQMAGRTAAEFAMDAKE